MQYRYSATYLNGKFGLSSWLFKTIGIGLFGFAISLHYLSSVDFGAPRSLLFWGFILMLGVLIGIVFVKVRRLFRPPEQLMRAAFFEVDRHGLWRQTPKSRDLLIGGRELVAIEAHRSSPLSDPWRVDLCGPTRSIQVQGLEAMWQFAEELRTTFPHAEFREVGSGGHPASDGE